MASGSPYLLRKILRFGLGQSAGSDPDDALVVRICFAILRSGFEPQSAGSDPEDARVVSICFANTVSWFRAFLPGDFCGFG